MVLTCVGGMSLKPSISLQIVWTLDLWLTLLGVIATPNSPIRMYSPPPAARPPTVLCTICDITVVLKKVAQNPAVLLSYVDSYGTLPKRLATLLYYKSTWISYNCQHIPEGDNCIFAYQIYYVAIRVRSYHVSYKHSDIVGDNG